MEDEEYEMIDRMGTDLFFKKNNSENESYDFCIGGTEDWCHWFRIYMIDNGYTIENVNE